VYWSFGPKYTDALEIFSLSINVCVVLIVLC